MSTDQQSHSTSLNGGLNSGEVPQPIMPKTYLAEAILVTCLCCLPFGLVGIINATKVEGAYFHGDYQLAEKYSREAKKWSYWGAGIAAAGILLYVLAYAAVVFFVFMVAILHG